MIGAKLLEQCLDNGLEFMRPLDQRRIDSRLMMMYKVAYELTAIPASFYFVRNKKWPSDISKQSKTITGSHSSPCLLSNGTPSLPTYGSFPPLHSLSLLSVRRSMSNQIL